MFNLLALKLFEPLEDLLAEYVCSIDGVSYIPYENIDVLLGDIFLLFSDFFKWFFHLSIFSAISSLFILGGIIFLWKALDFRRKERNSPSPAPVDENK